ncbi:MAG: DUF2804 domain-containing protein [Spirochaetaceae bacterium]|jgi:hypothetical protein|nr:DUF2804 domain-containing protein [Spirochaetaceae bacterium]
MSQTEIEASSPVFAGVNYYKNFGWARRPLFLYNPQEYPVSLRNITESDSYIFFSNTHLFVFEITNYGWTRYVLITAFSLREKKVFTKIINVPFLFNSFMLPQGSESGDVRIHRKGFSIHFIVMNHGDRILKADIPHFKKESPLRSEIVLTDSFGSQSIVTNLPWKDEKARFQCIRCSPWYEAEGVVQIENKEIVFSKGKAWGIFLWSRTARPRQDAHFWAAGCGMIENRLISFSIGYGTADDSFAGENAFFINGKIQKLGRVAVDLSQDDWMRQRFFWETEGLLEMKFTPLEAGSHRQSGIFQNFSTRRAYGVFSGRIRVDEKNTIVFYNITGIMELRKTWK